MNKPLHQSYNIGLKVLTPVHIGAGNEKTWMRGVDFLVANGQVRVLRQDALFKELMVTDAPDGKRSALEAFSALLSAGKRDRIADLIEDCDLDLRPCTLRMYDYKDEPANEIRPLVRDGMGRPYLPGSSLKGAIRSAIFQYLYSRDPKAETRFLDADVLGEFDKSITRFIRPADTVLPETALHNTTLHNLYDNRGFGWKSDWKPNFLLSLETFRAEQAAVPTRLSISDGFIQWLCQLQQQDNKGIHLHPHLRLVLPEENPLQTLFNIINLSTREHIKREIKYFEAFPQAEGTQYIVQSLQTLKQRTENNARSCVLRMAYGSGYHGITGDWKFEDHAKTIDRPHQKDFNRPDPDKAPRYKSRKILDQNDLPEVLGFVELLLPDGTPDIAFKPVLLVPKPSEPSLGPSTEKKAPSQTAPQAPETAQTAPRTDHSTLMASEERKLWAEVVKVDRPFCKVVLLLDNYPFENIPIDLYGTKGVPLQVGQAVLVLISSEKGGQIKTVALYK